MRPFKTSPLKSFASEDMSPTDLRQLFTLEEIIFKLLKLQTPNLTMLKGKLKQAEECLTSMTDSKSASSWMTKLSEWRDAYLLLKARKDLQIPTINTVPTEVKVKIFQVLDPSEALFKREVCRSWRDNIESMYAPKKHVLIYVSDRHNEEDLSSRFFALNLDTFTKFSMKAVPFKTEDFETEYATVLGSSFLGQISYMFPYLKHLLIDTVLDIESANAIIDCLPTMKCLSSFSIFKASHIPPNRKLALLKAIRNCNWIERLGLTDLGKNWFKYLRPDCLEHFAYESESEDNIVEVVRRLSSNISSFWTRVNSLDTGNVTKWVNVSPGFIRHLKRLYVGSVIDNNYINHAYVNVSSFTSLYFLQIEFAYHTLPDLEDIFIYATLDPLTFGTMTGLTNLYYLELINFRLDLQAFNDANLVTLGKVTELRLNRFYVDLPFDGFKFCQIFSRLFPNLEKLSLVVLHWAEGEAVQKSYGYFWEHLQEFNFTVFATAPVAVRKTPKSGHYEFE